MIFRSSPRTLDIPGYRRLLSARPALYARARPKMACQHPASCRRPRRPSPSAPSPANRPTPRLNHSGRAKREPGIDNHGHSGKAPATREPHDRAMIPGSSRSPRHPPSACFAYAVMRRLGHRQAFYGMENMAVRCAILDDYQNVVLKVADWSKVKGDVEIKVFNEHLGGPERSSRRSRASRSSSPCASAPAFPSR